MLKLGCLRSCDMGTSRGTRSQKPPDDPEYVRSWAKALVAAVGKRQARAVLEDYRALASRKRLDKYSREVAAQRAKILKELL